MDVESAITLAGMHNYTRGRLCFCLATSGRPMFHDRAWHVGLQALTFPYEERSSVTASLHARFMMHVLL